MNQYKKNLLDALRLVPYEKSNDTVLTNDKLIKAVTLNEELKSLGYTLNPTDLINLAKSPSLDNFYNEFRELVPDITVSPMYPDFPTQVMNMDEATFKFHQAIHYFSTYGLESLFGIEVDKGWLPDVESTEKTVDDTKLLEAKVLELVLTDEMYTKPMTIILSKRERMTDLETKIINEALPNVSDKFLSELKIPFKENMESLFLHIANDNDRNRALKNLNAICQHTGDALRFTEKYLNNHKFHLKTSEKRLFVKLLESYPAKDLRANLVPSEKKVKRNLAILQHLDYNKYSRSIAHKEVVNDLRNNNIKSWEAKARKMIAAHNEKAINFVSQKPGMALRMVSLLVREGYDVNEIAKMLEENVAPLSTQTLISTYFKTKESMIKGVEPLYHHKETLDTWTLTNLKDSAHSDKIAKYILKQQDKIQKQNDKKTEKEDIRISKKTEALESVSAILKTTIEAKFRTVNTPIKNKKVFIKDDGIDLSESPANPSAKSMQSGYVPSTVTYKIPEDAKYIRAYVYWDDSNRVDVDLHATAIDKNGEYQHIGWNGDYNDNGIIHSGDITHSNAAEYIDIDLNGNTKYAGISLDLYSGRKSFKEVHTCFMGIMAVDKIDKKVRLYSPENSFFTHDVNCESRGYQYGYIDVENRTLKFIGKESERNDIYMPPVYAGENPFSMEEYLNIVIKEQNAQIVDSPEEADIVLTMAKPENEKELSLIDNNFFYDAKEESEENIEKEEIKNNESQVVDNVSDTLLTMTDKIEVVDKDAKDSISVHDDYEI